MILLRILNAFLFVLFIPFWPVFFLTCRFQAKPCPNCGERWWTELVGEWGDEMWKCRKCSNCWVVPYDA